MPANDDAPPERLWPAWLDTCDPATGEGIPDDATEEELRELLQRALQEGLDSAIAEDFDLDAFTAEQFPDA